MQPAQTSADIDSAQLFFLDLHGYLYLLRKDSGSLAHRRNYGLYSNLALKTLCFTPTTTLCEYRLGGKRRGVGSIEDKTPREWRFLPHLQQLPFLWDLLVVPWYARLETGVGRGGAYSRRSAGCSTERFPCSCAHLCRQALYFLLFLACNDMANGWRMRCKAGTIILQSTRFLRLYRDSWAPLPPPSLLQRP